VALTEEDTVVGFTVEVTVGDFEGLAVVCVTVGAEVCCVCADALCFVVEGVVGGFGDAAGAGFTFDCFADAVGVVCGAVPTKLSCPCGAFPNVAAL
jgi:hypothetical protein